MATHEVRLGGQQPVLLHGGGLLGVVLSKEGPGGGERGEASAGWYSSAVGRSRRRRNAVSCISVEL